MSYSAVYALPDREPADGDSIASTTGWLHWCNAALARGELLAAVAHLAAFGWCDAWADLEHELEQFLHAEPDADLSAITAGVLAAVRARPSEDAVLMITDGEPAGDEDDEASESREDLDPLAALTEARVARKDGETWQVGSNWYTKRDGKIRKTAGPQDRATAAAKANTLRARRGVAADAAAKLAAGGKDLTHDDVVNLDDHFATLPRDKMREIARAIGAKVGGLKAELAARLIAEAKARVAGKTAAAPEPPPPPPVPAAVNHPATAKILTGLNASPGLSDEQRERYGAAVARVVGSMPKAALDRIHENLESAHFHPTARDVGPAAVRHAVEVARGRGTSEADIATFVERNAALVNGSFLCGGAYSNYDRSAHLDGDQGNFPGRHGATAGLAHGIYAHELGHAIDGPAHEISKSPDWADAFQSEIAYDPDAAGFDAAPLTHYAASKPSEGLAEFARLVHGSDVPHAQIAAQFPKAAAIWKARGLWPDVERSAAPATESARADRPRLDELFSHRASLDPTGDDGAHADVLLDPLDPAAVACALAQLRAEGDDEAAAELLHLIGESDVDHAAAESVDRPTPDELLAAALQIAEHGAATGEDTSDAIAELFAAAESVAEGFTGTVTDRLGRTFHYQDGKRVAAPKDPTAPKPPTRAEVKAQKRQAAASAASEFLARRKAGKPVTEAEARTLSAHLTHLTHQELRQLRQTHGATFAGATRKKERIDALVKWAQDKAAKKRRAQQGSALQQVVDYGGIDPQSEDFKRFYGSLRDAVNDGVPLAAFKKGGMGLDALAQQMRSSGHILLPDGDDPSEHLVGLLRGRKMLRHAADDASQYDDAYQAYLASMADDEHSPGKFNPNATIDWESRVREHQGTPPFPGAVFDTASHRWKNPHTGEEPPADPNHPHQEHAAATAAHDAQSPEARSAFERFRGGVADRLSQTAGGRVVLAMGRGGAWLFHQVEHRLLYAAKKTQEVAVAAAQERGLDADRTAKLKRALYLADFLGGYATGGAALAIAGPIAGKVAAVMPSASVAYLAYSTAKNPAATWRAAKAVIASTFAKGPPAAHESISPELAARLAELLRDAADPDWVLALFHAALAHAGGDAEAALAATEEALRQQPAGPQP